MENLTPEELVRLRELLATPPVPPVTPIKPIETQKGNNISDLLASIDMATLTPENQLMVSLMTKLTADQTKSEIKKQISSLEMSETLKPVVDKLVDKGVSFDEIQALIKATTPEPKKVPVQDNNFFGKEFKKSTKETDFVGGIANFSRFFKK